jgi:hypothetical protein
MHDLLPAVEKNAREIARKAANALGVLGAAESMPGPTVYQKILRQVAELHPLWVEHLQLLSQAYPLIRTGDDRARIIFKQFERDAADTAQWLEVLSSAGWARTPEIGVNSIRVRATQTLTAALRQMDREQKTVLPLLCRTVPKTAAPVVTGAAAAVA